MARSYLGHAAGSRSEPAVVVAALRRHRPLLAAAADAANVEADAAAATVAIGAVAAAPAAAAPAVAATAVAAATAAAAATSTALRWLVCLASCAVGYQVLIRQLRRMRNLPAAEGTAPPAAVAVATTKPTLAAPAAAPGRRLAVRGQCQLLPGEWRGRDRRRRADRARDQPRRVPARVPRARRR